MSEDSYFLDTNILVYANDGDGVLPHNGYLHGDWKWNYWEWSDTR